MFAVQKTPEISKSQTFPSATIQHVLLILSVGYIALALLMYAMNFEFIQVDTAQYWRDSFNVAALVNVDYLPLYLVFLAVMRTITFGVVPPAILMMSINLGFLLLGAWLIYQMVKTSGGRTDVPQLGALLYGFWPLIGLPYAVYPRFDVPPMTLMIGGLYFLQQRRVWAGAGLIGLALVGHKTMVPIGVLSLAITGYAMRHVLVPTKLIGFFVVGLLPLGALWIAGTIIHGSPLWLIAWNLGVQVESLSSLPVLDGALGTFLGGTPGDIIKGVILAGFAALAILLAVMCIRRRPPSYLLGVTICAEIVLLWLTLNSFEIWAEARASRLLVLPLVWVISSWPLDQWIHRRWLRPAVIAFLAATTLSQFVYGWYMVKFFQG